jgi:hypothetical protein
VDPDTATVGLSVRFHHLPLVLSTVVASTQNTLQLCAYIGTTLVSLLSVARTLVSTGRGLLERTKRLRSVSSSTLSKTFSLPFLFEGERDSSSPSSSPAGTDTLLTLRLEEQEKRLQQQLRQQREQAQQAQVQVQVQLKEQVDAEVQQRLTALRQELQLQALESSAIQLRLQEQLEQQGKILSSLQTLLESHN